MSVAAWLAEQIPATADGAGARGAGETTGRAETLADLRATLDEVAREAVRDLDGGSPGAPLRVSKSRLAALEQCERSALAHWRSDDEVVTTDAMLKGVALDQFVAHQLTGARLLDPARDLAAMLAAAGEWEMLYHLESMDESDAAELLGPLATSTAESWSTVPTQWWARTQARSTLVLGDGAVVVSGVVDVELGGAPTQLPCVIVEVKSGRPVSSHLAEVYLYALLVALRDGEAPAMVARWYPGADPVGVEVTDALLESSARRLAAGITTWVDLQLGRAPTESPGPWCGWCPDASVCPSVERAAT